MHIYIYVYVYIYMYIYNLKYIKLGMYVHKIHLIYYNNV